MVGRKTETLVVMLKAARVSVVPTQSMHPDPSSVNVEKSVDLKL